MQEMRFYLIFSFLRIKIVNKQTIKIFEDNEDFRYSNFIWLDRKV